MVHGADLRYFGWICAINKREGSQTSLDEWMVGAEMPEIIADMLPKHLHSHMM
jgi:hypothetical protein